MEPLSDSGAEEEEIAEMQESGSSTTDGSDDSLFTESSENDSQLLSERDGEDLQEGIDESSMEIGDVAGSRRDSPDNRDPKPPPEFLPETETETEEAAEIQGERVPSSMAASDIRITLTLAASDVESSSAQLLNKNKTECLPGTEAQPEREACIKEKNFPTSMTAWRVPQTDLDDNTFPDLITSATPRPDTDSGPEEAVVMQDENSSSSLISSDSSASWRHSTDSSECCSAIDYSRSNISSSYIEIDSKTPSQSTPVPPEACSVPSIDASTKLQKTKHTRFQYLVEEAKQEILKVMTKIVNLMKEETTTTLNDIFQLVGTCFSNIEVSLEEGRFSYQGHTIILESICTTFERLKNIYNERSVSLKKKTQEAKVMTREIVNCVEKDRVTTERIIMRNSKEVTANLVVQIKKMIMEARSSKKQTGNTESDIEAEKEADRLYKRQMHRLLTTIEVNEPWVELEVQEREYYENKVVPSTVSRKRKMERKFSPAKTLKTEVPTDQPSYSTDSSDNNEESRRTNTEQSSKSASGKYKIPPRSKAGAETSTKQPEVSTNMELKLQAATERPEAIAGTSGGLAYEPTRDKLSIIIEKMLAQKVDLKEDIKTMTANFVKFHLSDSSEPEGGLNKLAGFNVPEVISDIKTLVDLVDRSQTYTIQDIGAIAVDSIRHARDLTTMALNRLLIHALDDIQMAISTVQDSLKRFECLVASQLFSEMIQDVTDVKFEEQRVKVKHRIQRSSILIEALIGFFKEDVKDTADSMVRFASEMHDFSREENKRTLGFLMKSMQEDVYKAHHKAKDTIVKQWIDDSD